MNDRIPFLRYDADGSIHEGTAELEPPDEHEAMALYDFRDMDGDPMALPSGARFEIGIATGVVAGLYSGEDPSPDP